MTSKSNDDNKLPLDALISSMLKIHLLSMKTPNRTHPLYARTATAKEKKCFEIAHSIQARRLFVERNNTIGHTKGGQNKSKHFPSFQESKYIKTDYVVKGS